jgi:hypothetical protein
MNHPSPPLLALVPANPSACRDDRGAMRHQHRGAHRISAGTIAGPGWFESSWDLGRGLEVREVWSEEDRVRDWIEEFLAAQRTVARTASPSASTAIA